MAEKKQAENKSKKEKKPATTVRIKLTANDLTKLSLVDESKNPITIASGNKAAELSFRAKYKLEPRKTSAPSKKKQVCEKLGLDPETATRSEIYEKMLSQLQ